MTTLAAALSHARKRLSRPGISSPDLDGRLIVEHFTGTTRSDLLRRPGLTVPGDVLEAIEAAIARRLAGEPVHRILGFREFYGLTLKLSKDTLEPRPDTETLVDAALPFVRARIAAAGRCRILDLGTGTGAIALSLLHEAPGAQAVGVDISDDALATARANAEANGLADRFSTLRSDWFEAVDGSFDLIVSNPPYIRSGDIAGLACEVRDFDPAAALDGGADGLDAYRDIAESSPRHLSAGGAVGVEIGFDQRIAVAAIFAGSGFTQAEFSRDLGGNDRVILFQRG